MTDMYEGIEKQLKAHYCGWKGAEQFTGTGNRLRRMVEELCWPNDRVEKELAKCFKAIFIDSYDELLVSGPTEVWTLCPHHLLPCELKVFIGYIPTKGVLGLSKFSRIAVILGKRPVIQEMYSRELAEAIWNKLKPKGLGVYVIGRHGCMQARGVQQKATVTTSILKGAIFDSPEVRAEFYAAVKGGNGNNV